MKIVINGDVGSFRLSDEAVRLYLLKSGQSLGFGQTLASMSAELAHALNRRNDPELVAVVEQLGPRASAAGSQLETVEIPEGSRWHIINVFGIETVLLN